MLDASFVDRDRLPELTSPGTIIGNLSSGLAKETSFPGKTPVILAGGDQQVAALGMESWRQDPWRLTPAPALS